MQTLFEKHQTKKEIEAEKEFEEWKLSGGTSAVISSLRWSVATIVIYITTDALSTLSHNESLTIQNCILDNIYLFIGFLFFGAVTGWIKNNKFRKKLKEERNIRVK